MFSGHPRGKCKDLNKNTVSLIKSKILVSLPTEMRVFYFKRHAWTILLAVCIFIGGNIVLFYKFMARKELEHKRIQKIAKMYFQRMNMKPSSRIAILADSLNKKRFKGSVKDVHEYNADQVQSALEKKETVTDSRTGQVDKENTQKYSNTLETQRVLQLKTERTGSMQRDVISQQLTKQEIPSDNEFNNPVKNYKFGVLVIACNRPTVQRCLDQLLKYRPSAEQFPIVVSQDCGDYQTATVIRSYGDQITHIRQPDLGNVKGVPHNMVHFMGYYKISRHFKWALGQMFDVLTHDTVIIVEDDLDIAPDFFEYFSATRPLLDQDQSLWCVSAWNDNGKEGLVKGNDVLYRTDFFSGLGWMITKNIWKELKPKWPLGFWDDWIREPAQHKNRACIRPEICRTKTFGKVGVSKGQFFEQHLQFIKLNDKAFPFTKTDLSYLLKEKYDPAFKNKINRIPKVTVNQLTTSNFNLPEARIQYSSRSDFESIANSLGIMSDFKAGIARVSYFGVVSFIFKDTRVFLAPDYKL